MEANKQTRGPAAPRGQNLTRRDLLAGVALVGTALATPSLAWALPKH